MSSAVVTFSICKKSIAEYTREVHIVLERKILIKLLSSQVAATYINE